MFNRPYLSYISNYYTIMFNRPYLSYISNYYTIIYCLLLPIVCCYNWRFYMEVKLMTNVSVKLVILTP